MELWKRYEGNDKYHVSNQGQVKSFYKSSRHYDNDGFILSHAVNRLGYCKVFLKIPTTLQYNKYKLHSVHRLVAMLFVPNPDNKPEVNHIDGNKQNNVHTNLEWVTHSENIQKSYDTGQRVAIKGKDHWQYGKKASKDTRRKQSITKLGKKHPKYKGIYIVHGRKYYSALECERLTGLCAKTVIRRCRSDNKDYSFVPDPDKIL